MKIFINLIIGLIIATTALGQSVNPKVFPSSGGVYNFTGGSLSFSIGQAANTTITSGGISLSQGFQQPSYKGIVLPPPIKLVFTVDITNYLLEGNTLDTGGIRIAGNFADLGSSLPNWQPLSSLCKMQNITSTNQYTLTVYFPDSAKTKQLYFKFVNTNWGKNEGLQLGSGLFSNTCGAYDGNGSYNRIMNIPVSDSNYAVCWDKCSLCNTSATLPTVTTGTISFSKTNSIVLTGNNVTATGGSALLYKGIIVSRGAVPSFYNTYSSWYWYHSNPALGVYTDSIQSFIRNGIYYARAFAINDVGISYGNILSINGCAAAISKSGNITGCGLVNFNGKTYTSNTTVKDTLKSILGCDSVYNTTNIIINQPTTSTNTATACSQYVWNGVTYTTSGTYTKTFIGGNSKGCDSTATLKLTINNITTSTTSKTACGSYFWNGVTYTSSGTYTKTFTGGNSNGCDSIATLNLTIFSNTATTKTTNPVGCNSVTHNGITYYTSTVVRDTIKSSHGCDSVYNVANITVIQNVTPSVTISSNPSSTTISGGTSITLTANPTNGGTSPTYVWKKNNNTVGANSATYTDVSVHNNDTYLCVLTSNATCLNTPNATSNSIKFKVTASISSFTPTSASVGTTVTISGYSFTGATAVSFGGVAASSYSVIDDNTINAVVAKGASGTLSVTTPAGVATKSGFIYTKALTDSLVLNPATTPTSGGYNSVGTYTISFTVGGPVNLTFTQGNTVLTQGFQQPNINVVNSNPIIAGTIRHPKGFVVTDLRETLKGTSTNTTLTDALGAYSFNAISGGNYTIAADAFGRHIQTLRAKDKGSISSIDVALTQSHILGKVIFNSPYKIIAADVNNDKKVSALDIVFMKRMILGLDTSFSGNKMWGFVDSSYTFTSNTNPFPFRDSITYTGLSASKINQSFIGFILGDVDWSTSSPKSQLGKPIELSYNATGIYTKELCKVPVMVKNFKDVLGLQYTLNYNKEVFDFVGIQNNALGIEFAIHDDGKISFIWSNEKNEATTLQDGSILFDLVLIPKRNQNNEVLNISSDITAIEAVDKDYQLHGIVMKPSLISSIEPTKESFVIAPNPTTNGVIHIQMNLKNNKTIILRLLDNTGRVLLSKQVEGEKGANNFTLNQQYHLAEGIYYLQTIGIEGEEVKKVIVK